MTITRKSLMKVLLNTYSKLTEDRVAKMFPRKQLNFLADKVCTFVTGFAESS